MNLFVSGLLRRDAWNGLRTMTGNAADVPAALADLASADSAVSADQAYWRLDNRIVVQGQPLPAAIAAIPVLLGMCAIGCFR